MKKLLSLFGVFLLLGGTAFAAPSPQALLTTLTTAITNLFTGLTTGLTTLFSSVLNITTSILTLKISLIATGLNLTAALLSTAVNLTVAVLQLKVNLLTALVNGTIAALGDEVANARELFVNLLFNTTFNLVQINTNAVGSIFDSFINVSSIVSLSRFNFINSVLNSTMGAATSLLTATTSTLTELAMNVATSVSMLLNNITVVANTVAENLLTNSTTLISTSATDIVNLLNSLSSAVNTAISNVQPALTDILGDTAAADANAAIAAAFDAQVVQITAEIYAGIAANPNASSLAAALPQSTIIKIAEIIKISSTIVDSLSAQYSDAATDLSNPFFGIAAQLYSIANETELAAITSAVNLNLDNIVASQYALVKTVLGNLRTTVNKAQKMLASTVANGTAQNYLVIENIRTAAASAFSDRIIGPVIKTLFNSLVYTTNAFQNGLNNLDNTTTAAISAVVASLPALTGAAKVNVSVSIKSAAANVTAALVVGSNVENYGADCVSNGLNSLNTNTQSVFNDMNMCVQVLTDKSLNPYMANGNLIQKLLGGVSGVLNDLAKCLQSGGRPRAIASCLGGPQNTINWVYASGLDSIKAASAAVAPAAAAITATANSCLSSAVSSLLSSNDIIPIDLLSCMS